MSATVVSLLRDISIRPLAGRLDALPGRRRPATLGAGGAWVCRLTTETRVAPRRTAPLSSYGHRRPESASKLMPRTVCLGRAVAELGRAACGGRGEVLG